MKGTMLIKKLNKKQRCIIGDKDYDEKIGGDFWFVLTPLINCDDQPFFYYKKVENGYLVEGEGYICTEENSAKYIRARTNRLFCNINYVENLELKL